MTTQVEAITDVANALTDAASDLASAITSAGISPNCADSNMEPANIVDGLYQLASAVRFAAKHLASAIRGEQTEEQKQPEKSFYKPLRPLAEDE